MSLPKHPKAGAAQLPKSVKVRSTCNACQQAKIRCSHEKPSCRRCQKHKIDCIYSVSRRLGRPAKKKEPRVGLNGQASASPTPEEGDRPERQKRRKPAKKKSHSMVVCRPPAARVLGKSNEEQGIQAPICEVSTEVPLGLEPDNSSENWLQELISTHVNGDPGAFTVDHGYGDIDLDEVFDLCPEEVGYAGPAFSLQPADIYPGWVPAGNETIFERDFGIYRNPALNEHLEPVGLKDRDQASWLCAQSPLVDTDPFLDPWNVDGVSSVNILIDPATQYETFQSPQASHESGSYSPEDTGILPTLEATAISSCGCYRQAMSELVRSSLKGLSSIDEILNSQKEVLLQTEAILQCKICSRSEAQANLLMIVVVTIDSLLTTLDTVATLTNPRTDEGAVPPGTRRQSELGGSFKSQIDTCPLFVGGFPVPMEEKTCFIRQVLQVRLSMLLLTVRRIRVCMQQHLAAASSRGRLFMIIETERRLQLIMMRIKIAMG